MSKVNQSKMRIYQRKNWHASKKRFRTFINRAYESNTFEKLRDFLTIESPELQPEAVEEAETLNAVPLVDIALFLQMGAQI